MGNCLTAFLRDPGWREVKGREDNIEGNLRSFSCPQALPSPTPMLLIFYIKSALASRQPFYRALGAASG